MLRMCVCLVLLVSSVQSKSQRFYVDKVVVYGRYDARYIFRRENVILPPDKLVTQNDVACFLRELKGSGLIKDLRTRVLQRTADTRTLILRASYHPEIKSFVISEIMLDGLPEIDEAKFRERLNEKGLRPGVPLLKYYYAGLEERINRSLREALPLTLVDQYQGSAWITIRPAGPKKVKLIVSSVYPGCDAASAEAFRKSFAIKAKVGRA